MSVANLKPDYNFKYFLILLQAVIKGEAAPKPQEDVDWNVIYEISLAHSLASMLYYAIEQMADEDKPRGDFMPYLRQMYQEQLVTDINLTVETERILSLLSSKGIRCLPFKGINTKADYPVPHLRSMTDVDILCDMDKRLEIEKIFLSNGYIRENVGRKDTSYRKEEILHYEMHNMLVDESSPAYDYFEKIWERVEFDDDPLVCRMTLEDTYIFMLEHLANHLQCGGAGLRMYLDVYLFVKNNKKSLNKAYVDTVLREIRLSNFEKATLKICRNLFSGEEEIDFTSPAAEFLLNSSTFGRTRVAFVTDALKNKGASSARNGISKILSKLFPPLKWMRLRFIAVDKVPVLYPVFVVVHWIDRLFISKNVSTANIDGYFVSDTSAQAIELLGVLESLGLKERI